MHINATLDLPNLQALVDKFETMYDRRGPDDCWEWTRALAWNGYGLFTVKHHQQVRAHRFSYVIYKGPLPASRGKPRSADYQVVRHKCHNPKCVNPKHLLAGTPKQNTADRLAAGRFRIAGESNRGAKLTEEQVKAIRLDTRHPLDIAAAYGLSRAAVTNIQTGKTWRTVKSPFAKRVVWLSGAEGSSNGRAKLTDADVLRIRKDDRPYPVIAAQYGIGRESVGNIKRRITWKHILGPE
jgi:hypothetical protein